MFSRRPTKNNNKSAPVLGQVPSQQIPPMNRTHVHDVGYYNEKVERTPRYAATANLFQAIQEYNDPKMVEECLKNGADPNLQDVEGKTPLMACITKHPKNIQLLLDHGADVFVQDYKGNTALIYAVMYGHLSFCQTLFNASEGKLVDFTNHQGQTPLMVIAEKGEYTPDPRGFRWLVQNGADANHTDKFGNTTLTLILRSLQRNDMSRRFDESGTQVLKILIEEGKAKVSQSDVDLAHSIDKSEREDDNSIPKVIELLEKHVKSTD